MNWIKWVYSPKSALLFYWAPGHWGGKGGGSRFPAGPFLLVETTAEGLFAPFSGSPMTLSTGKSSPVGKLEVLPPLEPNRVLLRWVNPLYMSCYIQRETSQASMPWLGSLLVVSFSVTVDSTGLPNLLQCLHIVSHCRWPVKCMPWV